jgi:hypothetical protein
MSETTIKKAIASALQDPKGHAQVSKAEAQAITKAATSGSGSSAKVTAGEARLIGKLLGQDAFEGAPSYTLTAPARNVLEQFAAKEHLPYGSNAGAMAGQIRGAVDAADLANATPLAKAPSTSSYLPLPLNDASFGLPAREAFVNPSTGQFYVKQGTGKAAQWYGPMVIPGSDAHTAQNAALQSTLSSAVQGLDLMSESDYGYDAVLFTGAGKTKPSAADFAKILGLPAGTPVEARSMDDFFGPFTKIDPNDDQYDDFQKAQAQQYGALRTALEQNLTDLQVFRTGDVQIGTYIVGRNPSGDLVGVHSTAVET